MFLRTQFSVAKITIWPIRTADVGFSEPSPRNQATCDDYLTAGLNAASILLSTDDNGLLRTHLTTTETFRMLLAGRIEHTHLFSEGR